MESCSGAVDEGGADGAALGAEGGVVVSVWDFGWRTDSRGVDFYGAGLGLEVEGCGGGGVGGGDEGEVDVDAAGQGVDFQAIAESEVASDAAGLDGEGCVEGVDGEMGGWEFMRGEFEGRRWGADGEFGMFGDRHAVVEDDIQGVGMDVE